MTEATRADVGTLRTLVDAWVELQQASTLATLRTDSPAPWASVGNGAGGIAWTLGHLAHRLARPELHDEARRWLRAARAAARLRSGFHGGRVGNQPVASSVWNRGPGLDIIELALHRDLTPANRRRRKRAVASLARVLRPIRVPAEIIDGHAGALLALLAVDRMHADPALVALGDELATRLVAPARRKPKGAFAHGSIGVQHAVVAWALHRAAPLPVAVARALDRSPPAAVVAHAPASFARSWCNGLAGHVQLWCKAFELTGDQEFRDLAIAAIPRLVEQPAEGGGSLCCGAGGRAYALLATERITGDRALHAHAVQLAAVAVALEDASTGGMLWGFSGLVGLAADLVATDELDGRFPWVD